MAGDRRYDVTHRPLVMGILNRTRDSFYDGGRYLQLDSLLRRAEHLVETGADILEIGARPGGVGVADVDEATETALVCESIECLRSRFDVPLAVDTWRANVAEIACELSRLAGDAMAAGLRRAQVILDPGLDLGKTWMQSLQLLAALGHPVLLAASNKVFLGRLLDLEKHERGHATVAACAIAAVHGARLLRVHDAVGARSAADLCAAVLSC